MEQIKVFLCEDGDSDAAIDRMIAAANAWLREHADRVIQRNVSQDALGAPMFIFFFREA